MFGEGAIRRIVFRGLTHGEPLALGRVDASLLGEVIGGIIPAAGLFGSRTDGDILGVGDLRSIRVRRAALGEGALGE
jgi:hypothetical protein